MQQFPELPPEAPSSYSWQRGLELLKSPAWPLCNMAVLLYFAGPYTKFQQLLADLPSELEVASITYQAPAKILTNFLKFLNIFETLKHPDLDDADSRENPDTEIPSHIQTTPTTNLMDEQGKADPFETALLRAKHNIVDTELEAINSLLCAPCECTICCTGPASDAIHDFFEIPLSEQETRLFELPKIDTEETRRTTPYAEKSLKIDGNPFHSLNPAIYKWENGWSLILTKEFACPALSHEGKCTIYQSRPRVCRKPQIFSGIIERQPDDTYQIRNRLIAVQDCPYVRELTEEITHYASLIEADLIIRANKA